MGWEPAGSGMSRRGRRSRRPSLPEADGRSGSLSRHPPPLHCRIPGICWSGSAGPGSTLPVRASPRSRCGGTIPWKVSPTCSSPKAGLTRPYRFSASCWRFDANAINPAKLRSSARPVRSPAPHFARAAGAQVGRLRIDGGPRPAGGRADRRTTSASGKKPLVARSVEHQLDVSWTGHAHAGPQ